MDLNDTAKLYQLFGGQAGDYQELRRSEQAKSAKLIVTLEDGAVTGGFGTGALEVLAEHGVRTPIVRLGWPDRFVGHATDVKTLRAANGLSPDQMLATAKAGLK